MDLHVCVGLRILRMRGVRNETALVVYVVVVLLCSCMFARCTYVGRHAGRQVCEWVGKYVRTYAACMYVGRMLFSKSSKV